MIPWLAPEQDFPPTPTALDDPNGLLAAGGTLSPTTLLRAYSRGIFPWYDAHSQPILWWSPQPRCVLWPENIHISRSLRRHLRNTDWHFTLDRDFPRVMRACAAPREAEGGSWISETLCHAYGQLHELGHAHSVEAWQGDNLAGGLYGVKLGGLFFGESMVSPQRNGSKAVLAALKYLAPMLNIVLIDCQVENPHLLRMGASMMDRATFENALTTEISTPPAAERWPTTSWRWPDLANTPATTGS